jgi:hypothetical protein
MFQLRLSVFTLIMFSSSLCFSAEGEGEVDSRIDVLGKLINISSGARQVINSDNPEVEKSHLKAKEIFLQAKEQFELGNNTHGSALLDQAAKTMFNAIRLATPSALGSDKLKYDFDNRKKSVNALSEAFNRIVNEPEFNASKKKTNQQLKNLLANADKLMATGEHAPAKIELDKAYHLLKVSIESLRGGQTLVRSLNFSSVEEEYHYELDRNNTHRMLIKLLLNKKESSDYTKKMVMKFIRDANSLRSKADQAARKKEFDQAIQLLEQSTKQLVRAIRSAGVYIPG